MAWHELKLFAYLNDNAHTRFDSISIVQNCSNCSHKICIKSIVCETIVTIVSVAAVTGFVTVTKDDKMRT